MGRTKVRNQRQAFLNGLQNQQSGNGRDISRDNRFQRQGNNQGQNSNNNGYSSSPPKYSRNGSQGPQYQATIGPKGTKPPSRPCKYCGQAHYDNACPQQNRQLQTVPNVRTATRPCKHCGQMHFDNECPQRNGQQKPAAKAPSRPCRYCQQQHFDNECPQRLNQQGNFPGGAQQQNPQGRQGKNKSNSRGYQPFTNSTPAQTASGHWKFGDFDSRPASINPFSGLPVPQHNDNVYQPQAPQGYIQLAPQSQNTWGYGNCLGNPRGTIIPWAPLAPVTQPRSTPSSEIRTSNKLCPMCGCDWHHYWECVKHKGPGEKTFRRQYGVGLIRRFVDADGDVQMTDAEFDPFDKEGKFYEPLMGRDNLLPFLPWMVNMD